MKSVAFGNFQDCALPNIKGTFFGETSGHSYEAACSGAFYMSGSGNAGVGKSDKDNKKTCFDASRCSNIYKNNINEVIVKNRNYLPIIKLG